jgi:predicted amidohydrolase YtcJ
MRVDAVYTGGRIRTMDTARPAARTMAVSAGRILALDDEAEALTRHASRVIDLGGAPVVPAFNDVHHHLTMRGQRLRGVDLRSRVVATMDELHAAVRAAAATTEPGAWIYGAGYDQNKLGDRHPLAAELDAAAPDHPVWLEHVSGHMGVGNSLAFARAGYPGRRSVPDVDGGVVARDEEGRAAGLVQERAMDLLVGVYKPLPVEEIVRNIEVASRVALSEGIASITEPGIGTTSGIGNSPLDLHAFQTARERGVLGVRAQVMPYITTVREIVTDGDGPGWGLDLGLRTGLGDNRLRVGPLKVLTDGSLIGRSAAMTACYHGSDSAGYMAWDLTELETILRGAHARGFRIAAHAIGDQAVQHVLDIFGRLFDERPRPDARHRIEHFQVASDAQIARTAALGLIPVPQGRFISELGDGVIRAMGPQRLPLTYRVRAMLDAGIPVPGSSDAPVAEASPILNIHDLVNRITADGAEFNPQERVTPGQALHMYTVNSAYASCEERDKGRLAEGMLADFVVLSDDLLTVDHARIDTVRVGATVVDGEPAFDDGALSER